MKNRKRIALHGFNNLTKSLSFNIYDICYAADQTQRDRYLEYIDEAYSAERLTNILVEVADMIGANILNIARQDYDPQGASVTMLIAEQPVENMPTDPDSLVAHLDKSHITVHTYPESHPEGDIATFRVDIDVSTCGVISPLSALNFLIDSFESDIVIMDYRVRGFTRDVRGRKHFLDHRINSIQNFLSQPVKRRYDMIDVNVYQENLFHTKMIVKDFDLQTYLFGIDAKKLEKPQSDRITRRLKRELQELYYGRNFTQRQ